MGTMNQPFDRRWGPAHQTPARRPLTPTRLAVGWAAIMVYGATNSAVLTGATIAIGLFIPWFVRAWREETAKERSTNAGIGSCDDPLGAVLAEAAKHDGVYLGVDDEGVWWRSRPERAVLLLGPPRSGKTSSVIIPALIAHPGPAVSTSTKADVLAATSNARSRLGTVWHFDPTGTQPAPGARGLRWSPVTSSRSWDGAMLIARAMVTGTRVGHGTTDQTHWSRRAQALLAPLLHAAALNALGIDSVVCWVLGHELDQPGAILQEAGAGLACQLLAGLQNTEHRERSSIFSAAADALDAYSSSGALEAARDPNFDPALFARSTDTIYIHAPAQHQALAAPLVCGLLSEIRAATYRANQDLTPPARLLFALDEAANIAPLGELPAIAAEGGGQGLTLLACFQDLSQARARWGPAADGFITLFGAKLILSGIADRATLETISIALGEYDRTIVSETRDHAWPLPGHIRQTVSTQRQRVLPPGDIANIPHGHGLYLDGLDWHPITLTPAHACEPWNTITQPSVPPAGRSAR
jgi:type IV secretory pathway TraG/TraD family ATPase VirD4